MKTAFFNIFLVSTFLSVTTNKINGQNIYTIAGIGTYGFSGDGAAATSAQLKAPNGVAVDASGNIYVADRDNHRIRKINTTGIISTIAGTGVAGYSGDGGMAINAQLDTPWGVAVDGIGNVYIADYVNSRIRKVNTSGVITTVAGIGNISGGGDGFAANISYVGYPSNIALDATGNLYIAEYGANGVIRKVNLSGIISTFAGIPGYGFSGDGGPATNAKFNGPTAIAFDGSGNTYIADFNNNRIRMVNSAGVISTFAGTGVAGFGGDGGLATSAQLNLPAGVAVDALGNVFISEASNSRIRKVNTAGTITTYAGTGTSGFSGDGGLSINGQLNMPFGIAFDSFDNLYIAEFANQRIRKVCPNNCLANINSLAKNSFEVLVYPNPNNGSFKFLIDNDIKSGQLILINAIGQKIHEQKIIQGTNEVKTNGLPLGLYNYVLLQDNQSIKTGKLTIE
jgi:hypothetical protein